MPEILRFSSYSWLLNLHENMSCPCSFTLMTMALPVLANMLMKSGINPFDSQEAKPYKNDVEIVAMTNLVTAYQNNDINEFENILKVKHEQMG